MSHTPKLVAEILGAPPSPPTSTTYQAVHLVNWGADADADKINAVDLVRLVQWASTADNPWAYVASNVQDLYRFGTRW